MAESIEEKAAADHCISDQREFFSLISKTIMAAANITELDNRLSSEIREIREEHQEFQKTLTPVLEAYKKGLTLKSKLGTIAIFYVGAMLLFPQLSPSSILSVIKILL